MRPFLTLLVATAACGASAHWLSEQTHLNNLKAAGIRRISDMMGRMSGRTLRSRALGIPADCTSDLSAGCCPVWNATNAYADECAPLWAMEDANPPPVANDTEIEYWCNSSCLADTRPIYNNLGSLVGAGDAECNDVLRRKISADALCTQDSNGSYCYPTVQWLLNLQTNGLGNMSALDVLNSLCTECGVKMLSYLIHLSPLEQQVFGFPDFLGLTWEQIPFVCLRDPATNDLCFQSFGIDNSSVTYPTYDFDHCTFCGRVAIQLGAADYGNQPDLNAFIDCGCQVGPNNQTCIAAFEATFPSNPLRALTEVPAAKPNRVRKAGSTKCSGKSQVTAPGPLLYGCGERPCLELMFLQTPGAVCCDNCAQEIMAALNSTGCCTRCVLAAWNETVNYALAPLETIFNNIDSCVNSGLTAANLDYPDCPAPAPITQNLTLCNLNYTWVTYDSSMSNSSSNFTDSTNSTDNATTTDSSSRQYDVEGFVIQTIAFDAGINASRITIVNVVEGDNHTTVFEYTIVDQSADQNMYITQLLQEQAEYGLLNFTALLDYAAADTSNEAFLNGQPDMSCNSVSVGVEMSASPSASSTAAPTPTFSSSASIAPSAVSGTVAQTAAQTASGTVARTNTHGVSGSAGAQGVSNSPVPSGFGNASASPSHGFNSTSGAGHVTASFVALSAVGVAAWLLL